MLGLPSMCTMTQKLSKKIALLPNVTLIFSITSRKFFEKRVHMDPNGPFFFLRKIFD